MKELDKKEQGKVSKFGRSAAYAMVPAIDIVICASSLLKSGPVRGVPGGSIDPGTGHVLRKLCKWLCRLEHWLDLIRW